jgi:hypothetical protein
MVGRAGFHVAGGPLKAIDRPGDPQVTGIILQLPLPPHIEPALAQYRIDPYKDVEGVNPANIGLLFYGEPLIAPCTALAVNAGSSPPVTAGPPEPAATGVVRPRTSMTSSAVRAGIWMTSKRADRSLSSRSARAV